MPQWLDDIRVWLDDQQGRLDYANAQASGNAAAIQTLQAEVAALKERLIKDEEEMGDDIGKIKLDIVVLRTDLINLQRRVSALENAPPTPDPDPDPTPTTDYGPRYPVGPTDDLSLFNVPPGAVTVRPDDGSVGLIFSKPAGTTFVFEPGVYKKPTLWVTKDNLSFIAKKGATLDGENAAEFACNTGSPASKNFTLANFEIKNYKTPGSLAAVLGYQATGWRILNCDIHHNAAGGIGLGGDGCLIARNDLHHNGRIGATISGGADAVFEDNEISNNNYANEFPQEGALAEAGGVKFTNTDRLQVHYNNCYLNNGPGLWTDINNIHTLYEYNWSHDNDKEGIWHEISYHAVIRNNLCERNGHNHGWLYGAGIGISHSQNVEVYANVLRENRNGITGTDECRGSGAYGTYKLANVYIHDNEIVMVNQTSDSERYAAGFGTTCGRDVFGQANRYENNRYRLYANSLFRGRTARETWVQWRLHDDRTGTCEVV